MDQRITMSQKELNRYDIFKKLVNREMNGTRASELLCLSVRQVRRLKAKFKEAGAKGLCHGLRGRRGNRALPDREKERIKDLVARLYPDFGPTLAAEKLEERHRVKRSRSAIRSIMIAEEIWKPKGKKKEERREWRQRKANPGEMVQYDGSYEHWFEGRGEEICLLAAIDDATSRVWARFAEHEGVWPTFAFWREYVVRFGKPFSIYADKFSTYSMNHRLAQDNPDTLTQFERAMEQGLGVEVIKAHSPEAKGRIERLFKTLQDRLVKELRLKNISTIPEANKFLEEEFLPWFNARFTVEPRNQANLHKALTKQEMSELDSIFSRQYVRTVNNDFTVCYKKRCYQLAKEQPATVSKQDKVTIEERPDGMVRFRLRGKYLNSYELPEKPRRPSQPIPWILPKSTAHVPLPDHPWRQYAKIEYLKRTINLSK
jgi:transposase